METKQVREEGGRKAALVGLTSVGAYVLLFSIQSVYVANLLSKYDTLLTSSLCLATVCLVFNALVLRQPSKYIQRIRSNLAHFLLINISSCLGWIAYFFSLKLLEPAVANTVTMATIPIFTLAFGPLFRPGKAIRRGDIVSSVGVLVAVSYLAWTTSSGASGVRTIGSWAATLGLAMALLNGAMAAFFAVVSKKLSDSRWSVPEIMAARFYLFLPIALIVQVFSGPAAQHTTLAFWGAIALVSLVGLVAPLTLLQVGIQQCEPVIVALIASTTPLAVFVLQHFDDRISFSNQSFIGIVIALAFSIYGVWSRHFRTPPSAESRPSPDQSSEEAK